MPMRCCWRSTRAAKPFARTGARSRASVTPTAAAADDIVATLDAASTTSTTVTDNAAALDALLLNTIGFGRAGVNLFAPNQKNLIDAINTLEPTTALLLKYNPEYTCLLVGAKWWLDNGGIQAVGGNGRTSILDGGILCQQRSLQVPGQSAHRRGQRRPGRKAELRVAARCQQELSCAGASHQHRMGHRTGLRPNPGIGNPCWANYFPVTRAVPEPPSIRQCLPGPAIGPVPYPGAPPYGAPLYGPGGVPLWPGCRRPPQPPAPEPAPLPALGWPRTRPASSVTDRISTGTQP